MTAAKKQSSFAKQLQELEAITAWFEGEAIDLEEGLEKFERGMVLAKELRKRLEEAAVKIVKFQDSFPNDE